MTSVVCPICGRQIENLKEKGRPRQFHDDCRKLSQLLSWLENQIPKIRATAEKAKLLRGEIWRLANLFNTKEK